MFTGIIKDLGEVKQLVKEGSNLHITIEAALTTQLSIDQSVAHNGVCLTVVAIDGNKYVVTAIKETLDKTNVGGWKVGDKVNLELAMKHEMRLDGHIVQGHVDQTAKCIAIEENEGSWAFTFEFVEDALFMLVDKGSVCIDGVSLTVVKAINNQFSVAIIPYTFEHTVFKTYQNGSIVNIEFDIIGKYVSRHIEHYKKMLQ